ATGLGMRESSGRTNVGWDKSKLKLPKPIQPTEENSEAGLFQVSWDSRNRSPYLLKLYEQYKSNPNKCQLETFSEGVKPKSEPVIGNGKGAEFQTFQKECPAFAAEYVNIMLRVNRTHFGPLKERRAEYLKSVEEMFRDIEKILAS
ncbi:MAG: hypothetical protein ACK5NT_04035, partial [Pyrinomonadaceae bacterium]